MLILIFQSWLLTFWTSTSTAATQVGSSGTQASFVDPLVKGMQKIRSGWLRDFLTREDMESEIESEDGDILTTDEINFELHN